MCLEEADRFFEEREKAIGAALLAADSPEKAYTVACEFRALTGFMKRFEADVAVGTAASKKLMEE